jgi:hypothetical protein
MTQTIPRVLSPGGRTIDPRRCAVQPKPTVVLVVLLAASLFALLGLPARAQLAGKGSIKGSITDPTGAVVPNATVVAISNTRGTTLSTRSTSAGDYELSPLDADVYTVTTTAQGFSKTTQENVRVNALEIANLNVSLQVGSEAETVTVSAAPSPLETSNATLGATMEQEVYSALPIEMGAYGNPDQRRATDFAFLMPGVQGNNTSGNPTTNTGIVNGSGSRGAVSDVYIDGIPFVRAGGNGDPRYVWTAISVDAIDQFQVQTSGYSAIYEGQGVQNYTVKQGGNRYHGAVYEFFRNTALDTWGFFGANNINPATGLPLKPIEHSNEYGIDLGGPILPLARWRDKLFFFGNYNGFRYSSQTPTAITFPTAAEQAGNFAGLISGGIYDPFSQATCTAHSTDGPCRYRYGYGPGNGSASRGNPVQVGAVDLIPASEFSAVALNLQRYLPPLSSQAAQNNFNAPNGTGLTNWSTTDRIDYVISPKDTLTFTAAIGRQASSNPVGQTTAGRNVGPIPYNYGQTYAPKTAVGIIEDTYILSPHLINQFKWGYARYDGPTFLANEVPSYAAAAQGITNLPSGQGQAAFPIVTFSGNNAPTQWGGTTASRTIAENYTLLDNVQWVFGKHSLTLGGQIAWLLYQSIPATGGTTPLTIATAVTETAALNKSSNASPSYAATANTGLAYASFLVGEIDKGSLTQYLVTEYGARFRAISPYVQDNWKITTRLTLDLGLRYDFFPTFREVNNNVSYFNPNLGNPVTGGNGALEYTGSGANTCNCSTPVTNFYKNIGPRVGIAYQVSPKTVIRTSYGIMFTHGNAVGGGTASANGAGNLGFSAAPSFSANGQLLSTFPLTGSNSAFPAFAPAAGRASGAAYGTGYTTVKGYTGTPSTVGYADPYLGGRAPEYINWSFGFQHQWTDALTSNLTYVGSQGHFLPADGTNARGLYADQLDPKYLSLGSNLSLTGAAEAAFCVANSLPCPANFNTSQPLSQALKPFPFYSVTDPFGNVANANYHALQAQLNLRPSHGLTFMASYTWSRSIDDGGTFRSGYPIPAAFSGNGQAWGADRIERSVSTSNQPHHAVVTGVWDLPFGRTMLANNAVERGVLGGFKFSEIFQVFSGSPLAITAASCGTNPAQNPFSSPAGSCMPTLSPGYHGTARINGDKWGQGVTRETYNSISYIDSTAFVTTPAYVFGDTPRTAPYNLYGPGNYNLDLSLRRSFSLHITESAKVNLQADLYNVTNHTQFSVASTVFGNSSFGQVSGGQANTRRSAQLSARVEF